MTAVTHSSTGWPLSSSKARRARAASVRMLPALSPAAIGRQPEPVADDLIEFRKGLNRNDGAVLATFRGDVLTQKLRRLNRRADRARLHARLRILLVLRLHLPLPGRIIHVLPRELGKQSAARPSCRRSWRLRRRRTNRRNSRPRASARSPQPLNCQVVGIIRS